jgi:hypothetical protein
MNQSGKHAAWVHLKENIVFANDIILVKNNKIKIGLVI